MMMKELYDITVLFLRCLRNLKKWSWILNLRKNEEKSGKMADPESPNIHYCGVTASSARRSFLMCGLALAEIRRATMKNVCADIVAV